MADSAALGFDESIGGIHTKRKSKDRLRVTRACDHCKRKKIRCSGTTPCTLCVKQGYTCEYKAHYARGRKPPIPQLFPPDQPSQHLLADHEARSVSASHLRLDEDTQMGLGVESLHGLASSSRTSPEPSHADLEGHYVGPSSGVSFLLRAQKRLAGSAPETNSSIFTFGDAPLPKFDSSFFLLPSKDEAQALVSQYFEFAYPTHRFLHRPTVEIWLSEFYSSVHNATVPPGDREKRAILLMIMASAKQYSTGEHEEEELQASAKFFGASEHQLDSETGPIRLTSVQARLAQCFWLITHSRLNHCWSLFGTLVRLAFAIGLHRKRWKSSPHGTDLIEAECRKRTFWCAYSLDNYLSAALGRPRSFHDDDVDQELPLCVEDTDITLKEALIIASRAQGTMLAPICHAKLSIIIGGVLKDLYGIHRVSFPTQLLHADKHDKELLEWRKSIATFLDMDKSLLTMLYQRQHTVLSLASAHARILIFRPFLLINKDKIGNDPTNEEDLQISLAQNIAKCVEASLVITNLVRELNETHKMRRAFWFTHYYAFCAIVVLYVWIMKRHAEPGIDWQIHLSAAQRCQQDLLACAGPGSFAQRYSVVLDELKSETLNSIERTRTGTHFNDHNGQQQPHHLQVTDANDFGQHVPVTNLLAQENAIIKASSLSLDRNNFEVSQNGNIGETFSSFMTDMTNWGELDSLVMTGNYMWDFNVDDNEITAFYEGSTWDQS